MDIKGIERESRVSQVVETIQGLIRAGELSVGDRLLPERQLAERLGVSRGSVRGALAKLAGMGILEVTPRDGARIRRRQLDDAVAPLSEFFFQERQQVVHLLEVREAVETRAAELAARRATEADLLHLRELAQRVEADSKAGADTGQSDLDFHLALVGCAKNPLLERVMQVLVTTMREVYAPVRERMMQDPSLASRFIEEHRAIVAAIAARDGARARSLMRQHIADAMRFVDQVGPAKE